MGRVTRYLISFDAGAMDHIPEQDLVAVGEAAHAVMFEAKQAGVWVFGGGMRPGPAPVAEVDGSVADGAARAGSAIGGFVIVDVPTQDDALRWGARWAAACRCPQDVREIMDDPLV